MLASSCRKSGSQPTGPLGGRNASCLGLHGIARRLRHWSSRAGRPGRRAQGRVSCSACFEASIPFRTPTEEWNRVERELFPSAEPLRGSGHSKPNPPTPCARQARRATAAAASVNSWRFRRWPLAANGFQPGLLTAIENDRGESLVPVSCRRHQTLRNWSGSGSLWECRVHELAVGSHQRRDPDDVSPRPRLLTGENAKKSGGPKPAAEVLHL